MRWRATWSFAVVVAAGLAAACGTKATGISLSIEPDPVAAARQSDGSYGAEWDAVVADLTGVGGTVESIDFHVMGAASVDTSGRGNANVSSQLTAPSMAVAPFERRLFHESARFSTTSGQSVSVQVTARFRDENGVTHTESAEARVTLR
jgi:hypothetical protein